MPDVVKYKIRLAIVEATFRHSIAFVGSDREETDEASWWAERAGAVLMEVISLAPQLMRLPAGTLIP